MADLEKRDGPARPVQIRDFIFVRELSEVYLLLDFISGRWDKGLEPDVQMLIEEICEIGWPPEDGPRAQAHQAAILLKAKDKLNAAAKPASGATIAFTLLVVGEDDPRKRKFWGRHTDRRGAAARSGERTDQAARAGQGGAGSGTGGNDRRAGPDGGQGGAAPVPGLGGPSGPGGLRNGAPRDGDAAKVSSAEAKLAADELARLAKAAPQSGAGAGAAAPPAPPLVVYCDPARAPDLDPTPLAQRYRSVEEYHLCMQDSRLDRERAVTRRNLAAWLQPWKALYHTVTYFLEPIPEPRLRAGRSPRQGGDEETARILTLVLGSAVLPLCYGILGAGAAVVRDLWRKMRESMLSPRDYTLALGQLALGATIGACIGLFVNASGTGSTAEPALAGAWTLSGSALSFIAGFGVEGVFQAMESFVRRVFNVPDPVKPR